jgi:hypothetical protein
LQAALSGEAVSPVLDSFEVGYVTGDGAAHRVGLADAWPVRFELAAPARAWRSRRGQRHLPGRWWSATDDGHVGYESWLERDHVTLLIFEPTVLGSVSQPFWLSWTAAVVVDCRYFADSSRY